MAPIFQNPGILVLAMAWFRGSTSFHLLVLPLSCGLHFQAMPIHFVSGGPRSLEEPTALKSSSLTPRQAQVHWLEKAPFLLAQAKTLRFILIDVTSHL